MKSMKKKIITGLIVSMLIHGSTMNSAKADPTLFAVELTTALGLALATTLTIVNSPTAEDKQQIFVAVVDDAAAFIANDGQNATALLTQILLLTREGLVKQGVVEPVSDLEIAQEILAQNN